MPHHRMTLVAAALVAVLAPRDAAAAPTLDLFADDLEGAPVALDLVGDGDLVVATADADGRATLVRLDALGARIAARRHAGTAVDLVVDRRTGRVLVADRDGLTACDPGLAPLWRHPLPAAARIAIGEHGTVAALAGDELHVLDEHGRLRVALRPAVDEPRDLAVLDAAGLVAVTGASACDALVVAAHSLDGAALWSDSVPCDDVATRGVAVTRGGDGLLYVLAEVDGRLPAALRDRAHAVIDGYTDPETASPAQAAWFARIAADGSHLLGQLFALPDAGAVVRPAEISADEHGNVFLTGTTSHSLGAADEHAVTAALDAPAGFFQIVAPDFTARVWRPIEADGMTTELGALARDGDRVVALLHATAASGHADGALPPGPSILTWPDPRGPLFAEKRPDQGTQGTFGYESGVSGSDPTCYCATPTPPAPAALVALTILGLAATRRRR